MRYTLLGPVGMDCEGMPLAVKRPRCRAVLAYLLLHANRVVSTQQLIDALWGGSEPQTARSQIQADIATLRRVCRDAGAKIPVERRAPGYSIAVDDGELDLDVFRNGMARARQEAARGDSRSAVRLIRKALALWQGMPLADIAVSYAESAQTQLTSLRLTAYEDLADLEIGEGHYGALIDDLMPLVAAHPLHENLRVKLMLALYRSGRQTAALEQARELRSLLAEQQGLTPGRRFTDMEQAILRADPSLDAITPTPPAEPPHPLSEQESPPVPDAPDGALSDAPAAHPAPPVPMQLPSTPQLVGRRDLLDQLDDFLAGNLSDEAVPGTVAVVGPAGVGKTTLAVHWGRTMAERFPDGQLYINLHGHDMQRAMPPTRTIARALRSLGLSRDAIPAEADELIDLYRSTVAGKRLLVLLDNARSVDQVRPLLTTGPGSVTLITSRFRLTGLVVRDGARQVAVGPMSPQEAEQLLEHMLGAERLRAEPGAAHSLAEACGRIPLALSIAAANIANDPLASIADHIRDLRDGNRLAALQTPGDSDSTMQTVLGQSYDALDPDARRLFRLLGLSPGPDFTVAAASVLAGLSRAEAGRLVDRLLDAHLIDQSAADRFALHDLTRLYARARAEAEDSRPDRERARGRLTEWYLERTLAAQALAFPEHARLSGAEYSPGADFDTAAEALTWFDNEIPNLIAALHDDPIGAHTWRIADGLRPYFATRMNVGDWIDAANAAITAAERVGNAEARFSGWYSLAHANMSVNDYSKAMRSFRTALSIARTIDHRPGINGCENFVAQILIFTGHLDEAARRLESLMSVAPSPHSVSSTVVTLSRLGEVYCELGRLADSLRVRHQALELATQAGARSQEPYALVNLAIVKHALGDVEEAGALYTRALITLREFGDTDLESAARSELAAVHLDAGRPEAARVCAEHAWRLAQGLKAPRWSWLARSVRATVNRDLPGHLAAVVLADESGNPGWHIRALVATAATAEVLGRPDAARDYAYQALELAVTHHYRMSEADSLLILARTQTPGSPEAHDFARRALAIHRQTGRRLGEQQARALLEEWGTAEASARVTRLFPVPARQTPAPARVGVPVPRRSVVGRRPTGAIPPPVGIGPGAMEQ
ncbi:BTAD domain-containing putative transcriptional regulator [Streptomyces sp. NPDC002677]|uniref:AfsR/SARP family transcriptional regulator n=1 Tax=Streptomyces sp. NPDC002677 TaxID=3154774 RepID=UPI0033198668